MQTECNVGIEYVNPFVAMPDQRRIDGEIRMAAMLVTVRLRMRVQFPALAKVRYVIPVIRAFAARLFLLPSKICFHDISPFFFSLRLDPPEHEGATPGLA